MQMAKNLMEVTDFLKKGIDQIKVSCTVFEGAVHTRCVVLSEQHFVSRKHLSDASAGPCILIYTPLPWQRAGYRWGKFVIYA